jgi:hypothetical protein
VTRLAVSGHRELPERTESLIDTALRAEVGRYQDSELVGLSCIADGADALFAQAVVDVGGSLVVIVPAEKYRETLPESHHATYDALLSRAAEVIALDHVESDSKAHMEASLRMIERADKLIAIWDGKPARGYGGTADVVNAARAAGLQVTVI